MAADIPYTSSADRNSLIAALKLIDSPFGAVDTESPTRFKADRSFSQLGTSDREGCGETQDWIEQFPV